MKILLAGHVGYHWMFPFCKSLKMEYPEWEIDILGLKKHGAKINKEQQQYFNIVEPYSFVKKDFWKLLFTWSFIKSLIWILLKNRNLIRVGFYLNMKQNLLSIATPLLKENYYTSIFDEYDIINFQYIDTVSTQYTTAITNKNKVVLTFWGSDLMLTSGVKTYTKQLQLIEKADLIVIHSLEMREIFLAKYGRQFFPKITLNYFGLSDAKFEELRTVEQDTLFLEQCRKEWNIGKNKLCFLIGYSGSKRMQHEAIFKQIEKLSHEELDKIHLLIPMTYGNADQQYFKDTTERIKTLKCSYTHLTEYLSNKEVTTLYTLTDIFVNLCETDAFNGTMVECLYLNKIGIIGAWLPYGVMRRGGVKYLELEKITELGDLLSKLIDQQINLDCSLNRKIIYELTSSKYTIPSWCQLYKELVENKEVIEIR